MKRRLLSGLMTVLMLVNYLPVSVLSAEVDPETYKSESAELISEARKPEIPLENINEEVPEGKSASDTEITETLSGYCGGEGDGTNLTWTLTPEGVLTISGQGAMADYRYYSDIPWREYRRNITEIILEEGITTICDWAFTDCHYCHAFVVDENNPNYCSDEFGTLFNKNKTVLIQHPHGSTDDIYIIPSTVIEVSKRAFEDSDNLEEVFIPASVKVLGFDTFGSVDSLLSFNVDTNNTMFSSHNGVLYDKLQTELINYPTARTETSYKIPDGVVKVLDGAFWFPENLEEIILPDSLEYIGDYAFAYCKALNKIVIPANVSEIGRYAFSDCDQLTGAYFKGNAPELFDELAFYYCADNFAIYYIPGTTGWTDSDAYDADAGTWNGYPLATWDGVTIPGEDTDETTLPLSTVDYLALSDLVYDDLTKGDTVYEHLSSKDKWNENWEDTDILYSELYENLRNWEIIDVKEETKTGFYAAAFKREDEVIIAYRGSRSLAGLTEDFRDFLHDWLDSDLDMFFGGKDSQIGNAFTFYSDTAYLNSDCEITVTGHSLGGGLADMVAARYGIKGESFNSAPFLDVVFYHFPDMMAEFFNGVDALTFTAHVNEDDIIGNYPEERIKPKIIYKNTKSGFMSSHGLDSLLQKGTDGIIRMGEIVSTYTADMLIAQITEKAKGNLVVLGDTFSNWLDIESLDLKRIKAAFYGGNGNDSLFGSDQMLDFGTSDTLVGGLGNDNLNGRWGNDKYVYYKGHGIDTITDIGGNDELYFYRFTTEDRFTIETSADDNYINIKCNDELLVRIDKTVRSKFAKNFSVHVERDSGFAKIDDIGYMFHDKTYSCHMKVMCPVDVEIMDAEGNVVYTVKDGEVSAAYTEYGNFYVFEEDDGGYGKLLDLVEGYEVNVVGVDAGEMDIVVYEINESEFSEPYAVESVPVTDTMSAAVVKNAEGEYELQVDNDSDGTADNTISFEIVEAGLPEVEVSNAVITTDNGNVHIEADLNSDALPETTATVVVGFYNEGRQVDLHFEMIDLADGTLDLDFEISDDFDSCSLFIVNSAEEMIPIAAITQVQ